MNSHFGGLGLIRRVVAALGFSLASAAVVQGGIVVNPTTDTNVLGNALAGAGVTVDSVSITNGDAKQFGVYRNFSQIPNGVVLSTGNVLDTMGPPSPFDTPSTNKLVPGTPEFDAYGPKNIARFKNSNDVASLQVNFTLGTPSAVAFSFIFGSIEYPNFVSKYTDSFLVFLDGVAPNNQITFDSKGVPVQVGKSFANRIETTNNETAFGGVHGYIPRLSTTTGLLSTGSHTLTFEVGDVNDHILDSAVFLTNLRAATPILGKGGPDTEFEDGQAVPEPSSAILTGLGFITLLGSTMYRRFLRAGPKG